MIQNENIQAYSTKNVTTKPILVHKRKICFEEVSYPSCTGSFSNERSTIEPSWCPHPDTTQDTTTPTSATGSGHRGPGPDLKQHHVELRTATAPLPSPGSSPPATASDAPRTARRQRGVPRHPEETPLVRSGTAHGAGSGGPCQPVQVRPGRCRCRRHHLPRPRAGGQTRRSQRAPRRGAQSADDVQRHRWIAARRRHGLTRLSHPLAIATPGHWSWQRRVTKPRPRSPASYKSRAGAPSAPLVPGVWEEKDASTPLTGLHGDFCLRRRFVLRLLSPITSAAPDREIGLAKALE